MKKIFTLIALLSTFNFLAVAQQQEVIFTETFNNATIAVQAEEVNTAQAWVKSQVAPQSTVSGSSAGNYFTTETAFNSNTRSFVSTAFSTEGYTDIKLTWNEIEFKNNAGAFEVYSSTDGKNFTKVTGFVSSITETWSVANNGALIKLPASLANLPTVYLKWTFTIANINKNVAIDDIKVYGTRSDSRSSLNFNAQPEGDNPFVANKYYYAEDVFAEFNKSVSSGVTLTSAVISSQTFQNPNKSITLIQSGATATSGSKITTFVNQPVEGFSFTLYDVDRKSGQFQDIISVEGFNNNVPVSFSAANVTTSAANEFISPNIIQAKNTATDIASTSDAANVVVTFTEAVDKVVISYYNGDAAKGNQGMGMTNISWKNNGGYNPLPVELISFNGKAVNEASELNWVTASEKNNDKFIIERSTDGQEFTAIGTVKGNGTSNGVNKYSFTDVNAATGVNYYRLLQVDFDGTSEYSKMLSVKVAASQVVSKVATVYPNPAVNELHVQLPVAGEPASVVVSDLSGRQVATYSTVNHAELTVPVSDLNAGIYVVTVVQNGQQQVAKFVRN